MAKEKETEEAPLGIGSPLIPDPAKAAGYAKRIAAALAAGDGDDAPEGEEDAEPPEGKPAPRQRVAPKPADVEIVAPDDDAPGDQEEPVDDPMAALRAEIAELRGELAARPSGSNPALEKRIADMEDRAQATDDARDRAQLQAIEQMADQATEAGEHVQARKLDKEARKLELQIQERAFKRENAKRVAAAPDPSQAARAAREQRFMEQESVTREEYQALAAADALLIHKHEIAVAKAKEAGKPPPPMLQAEQRWKAALNEVRGVAPAGAPPAKPAPKRSETLRAGDAQGGKEVVRIRPETHEMAVRLKGANYDKKWAVKMQQSYDQRMKAGGTP